MHAHCFEATLSLRALAESCDPRDARGVLVPYAGTMGRYPVSTRINQVENDEEECARAAELEAPPQGSLFSIQ